MPAAVRCATIALLTYNDYYSAKVIAQLKQLNYVNKTPSQQSEATQNMRWECTLDGNGYKEYEVFLNDQPFGVISWNIDSDKYKGCWYTIASDGYPCYFQTQAEAINFLKVNDSQLVAKLSAKLKAEAHKLTLIAEDLASENIDLKVQDVELWEQVAEVKAGVAELEVKLKDARIEHNCNT